MKIIAYLILTGLLSVIFSSVDESSYGILEKSLPPVVGACLGGVLACTSIIVGILSGSSKSVKERASSDIRFSNFASSLELDIKILVCCLFAIVSLPYLRTLSYPFELSIGNASSDYLKHKFFSSLEIFAAIIAFCVIYELVSTLVVVLKDMAKIQKKED
ncbi:hypothetical protein HGF60_04525 [Alteromonadaceae bacterium A_SAG2]|nr:hypothetical protein [Alteromonadaceae bacterium A_SAG2]